MKRFDPSILIPTQGKLKGEIMFKRNEEHAPFLFWVIKIPFNDYILEGYPIVNPMLELGSTLPYHMFHEEETPSLLLKSWKELPFTKYNFANSQVDNIGIMHYNIPIKFFFDDCENNETLEYFDNIVDIEEIAFGAMEGNTIEVMLRLKIDFEGFNMHDPPFRGKLYSDSFALKAILEIEPVTFTGVKEREYAEAVAVASIALNMDDYTIRSEKKERFINLTQKVEGTEYFFDPKI